MNISGGVVHKVPGDLFSLITRDERLKGLWEGLTPLARNEWICWVISVKMAKTRAEHVVRVGEELKLGKRRPCCWIGCTHRTDKAVSPSVRTILRQ